MSTYEEAGVSIAAGEAAVRRIGDAVASTMRPEVLSTLGGFGGLFAIAEAGYRDPVLVATTDGVGTKAAVAAAAGRYDTIGRDLVAMCVDDLVCQGAEPLFFLDYVSVGRLDVDRMEALVGGVAEGCRLASCALIGGEMAEHPGMMADGDFDLVGFAVGAVERDGLIDGSATVPGDVAIGLRSPGLRSNGYSLARHVVFDVAGRSLDDPAWDEPEAPTWADVLLEPSVIYAPAISALRAQVDPRAIAHVTGGGLASNLARVLPDSVSVHIDADSWQPPRVFDRIRELGDISDAEMAKVFNRGVGMVVIVAEQDADAALAALDEHGHSPWVLGRVVAGDGTVEER